MKDPKFYPKDAWKGPDGRIRDSLGRICTPWGRLDYGLPLWNPPKTPIPADPREALPGLWTYADEVWTCIWNVFHVVLSSIAGDRIERRDHATLRDWVCNLELLVRRIILIAALTLEPPPLKPRPQRPVRSRAKAPHPSHVVADNPETWRVSFRLLKSHRSSSGERASRRFATPRMPTARGYALRIEALRRVIDRRQVYALRAARRLQRLAIANRSANEPCELVITPFSYHPSDRTSGKTMIEEPMRLAQPLAYRLVDRWQLPRPEPG